MFFPFEHQNRGPLSEVSGAPLCDPRVVVHEQDVVDLIRSERNGFDAIMLDVDNSPDSLIQRSNRWLYTAAGLSAIRDALKPGAVVSVWSVAPNRRFSRRLRSVGFDVSEHSVRAHGSRGARHQIWVARVGNSARKKGRKLVEDRHHDVPRRGRQT